MRDNIVFSLFDQIVEDDGGRGGLFEGESTERVEKRFIGSFSIPFSTVFKEGRIEGTETADYHCIYGDFFVLLIILSTLPIFIFDSSFILSSGLILIHLTLIFFVCLLRHIPFGYTCLQLWI